MYPKLTTSLLALLVAFATLPHASQLAAQADIPSAEIQFAKGASSATIKGSVTGQGVFDYKLTARAGQAMTVSAKAGTPSLNFNVMPPGNGAALYVGSQTDSKEYSGKLPESGSYTIRFYLMGNARDKGLKVPYTLNVAIAAGGSSTPSTTQPNRDYNQTLTLQGISFRVMSSVDDQGRTRLAVTPQGLEVDNSRQEIFIEGGVTSAEVADLNADGSPEVYVYTRGPGDAAKGSVYGWAANNKRSLSQISLPAPAPNDANFVGYRGGDQFSVVEGVLARRFPVNGKTRQLQYKLKPGEAGWILELDRAVEF